MKRILPVIFSIVLLWLAGIGSLWVSAPEETGDFPDRVNLALRQAGHQLLSIEGDSVSQIPPVEVVSPSHFRLTLEQSFNYDTLPVLLDKAFAAFGIQDDYRVTVERCSDNLAILGYNKTSFESGDVACKGREQTDECQNLVVHFGMPVQTTNKSWMLLLIPFILTTVIVSYAVYRRAKRQAGRDHASTASIVDENADPVLAPVAIGKYQFDHQNQVLQLDDERQDLTFRESKLLHQLARHINEVQTRDTLLEEVWADEGVIVGRSLDVFISRLRKLLQGDENVSIKNIHGVGYRLEVAQA